MTRKNIEMLLDAAETVLGYLASIGLYTEIRKIYQKEMKVVRRTKTRTRRRHQYRDV
jgi:hypothetical protein